MEMNAEPKVSAQGFWMDNAFDPKFTIVDCGYVKHPRARANAERLIKALGIPKRRRGWVEVAGHGRILIRVANGRKAVLGKFSKIKLGDGYCWTTHTYDKTGPQFDPKFAL